MWCFFQVTLESLEGKTYAVDASILLNQALKGMKDQPNAHLHVLFLRLCKLLTYKIKPIFVFDGGVPILKRQTIAARQRKREEAAEQAQSKFDFGFSKWSHFNPSQKVSVMYVSYVLVCARCLFLHVGVEYIVYEL